MFADIKKAKPPGKTCKPESTSQFPTSSCQTQLQRSKPCPATCGLVKIVVGHFKSGVENHCQILSRFAGSALLIHHANDRLSWWALGDVLDIWFSPQTLPCKVRNPSNLHTAVPVVTSRVSRGCCLQFKNPWTVGPQIYKTIWFWFSGLWNMW